MIAQLLFVCLATVLVCSLAGKYGETQLTVGFWKGGSNCHTDAKPAQANITYVLNKCYDGKMYDCDTYDNDVTYMIFADAECGAQFPKTYGLPLNMCLSPVYGYSSDDTYFWCH